MYQSYKAKYLWGNIIVSTYGSDFDSFFHGKIEVE